MDDFEQKYPRRSFGRVKNEALKALGTATNSSTKKGIIIAIVLILLVLAIQGSNQS